jgi:hypothetical protein
MTAKELRGVADFCLRAAAQVSRGDEVARMRQMAANYLKQAYELEKRCQPATPRSDPDH